MSAIILDLALARRIEFAEAQAAVDGAELLKATRPDGGAAVEKIAGGFSVFCGVNSPTTQAVGIGLDGPVTPEEIDHMESFYFSRRDSTRVELCPLADPSVVVEFGKRGYRVTEFSNVLVRPLDNPDPPAPSATALSIYTVPRTQVSEWANLVAQGFAEHFPVTPELLEVMEMFAAGPHTTCFLARVDGQPAGGACISCRDGIAGLFGASTLPAFRNRGIQTALLRIRLALARELGCELTASIALPGSISHRNIQRQGFSVLYTRVKFEKELPA